MRNRAVTGAPIVSFPFDRSLSQVNCRTPTIGPAVRMSADFAKELPAIGRGNELTIFGGKCRAETPSLHADRLAIENPRTLGHWNDPHNRILTVLWEALLKGDSYAQGEHWYHRTALRCLSRRVRAARMGRRSTGDVPADSYLFQPAAFRGSYSCARSRRR